MSKTQAEIIARLLVANNYAHYTDDTETTDWPLSINHSSAQFLQYLAVFDTQGTLTNRSMRTGLAHERLGFQIKCKAASFGICEEIMLTIKTYLVGLQNEEVDFASPDNYVINCITNTSPIFRLGKEPPKFISDIATCNYLLTVSLD